ncbi:50S ribosomal protein L18 [Candidatus Gottesmanbacteria bacterium RBG_16_37_8]|uniref:Large ribosomal subunit protein uL18 n=1 Tax=Candidatus Gottesmanbacteria bacterium RBG_16_37_8 TaxID=1798371 RepID=A0A1F5YV13_9BACT|nr:MAG: 50S ribosomal protein L18 [Candidatus Gottesmanbacteria bacterium RBG_16_37_8]
MIPKQILFKNKKKSIIQKGKRGTKIRPRLSVFRSNRLIYAQLIDDENGKTLTCVSEKELKKDENQSRKKITVALLLGELLAQKAVKIKIKTAIFDRRNYKYHGRVKGIAEGARKGGLTI